jgi:uncharacterized YccA/Bax inhibitor family protein
MRLKVKDLVATTLVTAVAVPYIGYLVRGEMPFIEDARGMSAIGLALGGLAYWVIARGDRLDGFGLVATYAAVVSLLAGFVALLFAEFAAAEVLLAIFMVTIVVVLAMKLSEHAGAVHWHEPTGAAR